MNGFVTCGIGANMPFIIGIGAGSGCWNAI